MRRFRVFVTVVRDFQADATAEWIRRFEPMSH